MRNAQPRRASTSRASYSLRPLHATRLFMFRARAQRRFQLLDIAQQKLDPGRADHESRSGEAPCAFLRLRAARALSRARSAAREPGVRLAGSRARGAHPGEPSRVLGAIPEPPARDDRVPCGAPARDPAYVGKFEIRQLPEAFKPTSPGGFMNPPGIYDRDPDSFFYIPTYQPDSSNFYLRAAIEEPRPILGHEGIPGHFLQISIANHVASEIRRQHADDVFIEGWALYGEELLLHAGLYPRDSAAHGQILRLSRYRSARIGADVNLHTGRWSFERAVRYFMEDGGLDREAAEGEAAGAASNPSQKIAYITGKWQIMRLLGRYRDQQGAKFRLGEFHDRLLSYAACHSRSSSGRCSTMTACCAKPPLPAAAPSDLQRIADAARAYGQALASDRFADAQLRRVLTGLSASYTESEYTAPHVAAFMG
jgi:hypothetical protein